MARLACRLRTVHAREPASARFPATPPAGFTLVESLVAVVLVALLLSVLFPVVTSGVWLARLAPEVADADQRMRVLDAFVRRVLEAAGEGSVAAGLSPTFAGRVPAIFPALRGAVPGDAPNAAFADRVTVLTADVDGWDVALASSMPTASSPMVLQSGPPCPVADPRCGFRPGDAAVLSDRLGFFDLLRVATVAGPVLGCQPTTLTRAYQVTDEARLSRGRIRQFRFDAASRQLRAADGLGHEATVADGVVGFACEYFGVADPPRGMAPPLGTSSCLTNADGTPRLTTLPEGGGGVVSLPLVLFTDGPFCGSGAMAYDADLSRIRRVVVRLWLRDRPGAVGQWPASALAPLGTAREVVIDVSPRNLG